MSANKNVFLLDGSPKGRHTQKIYKNTKSGGMGGKRPEYLIFLDFFRKYKT